MSVKISRNSEMQQDLHNDIPQKGTHVESLNTHDEKFNGGLMHVVHQLYFSVQKHLEHALSLDKGLSFSQFIILVGFSCSSDSHLTQARLAEYLMLTEATVSRHIRILVAKKFLHKEREGADKKSYKLSLSPLGKKVFTRAKKIIKKELDICFAHVSDRDREIIISNFTKSISILHLKK